MALALFGLVFGSFGNVVIWRFPRGESLSHPDSHCPKCEAPIQWRDNIPVLSWLLLRGRCRNCGVGISARYPLVEITSSLLWLAAGIRFGMTLQTVFAVAFFYILLLLAFIDLDTMRLPNKMVGLLAVIGLAGAAVAQLTHISAVPLLVTAGTSAWSPLVLAVVGALVCALPAFLLSEGVALLLKRPALGFGDVKLLAVMGMFMGAYGLMALFVGSMVGAAYGIIAGKGRAKSDSGAAAHAVPSETPDQDSGPRAAAPSAQFPFGPALVVGSVVVTLWGPQLWTWYLSLFAV